MDDATANPVFVALLCLARCLIPLIVMLGISYILRRLGLVSKAASPPQEFLESENNNA